MRRTLHLKLVLILVLLIVSLMVVVGAFLMNSVTGYYINDFYQQIADAFGPDNVDFVRNLETATQLRADAYSADLISGSAICRRWLEKPEAE